MKTALFTAALALALLTGCSPSKGIFYWGDYSSTLYDFKKEPSETTQKAHEKELLRVMKVSGEKNTKVPPGVNAEYGYILLRAGNETDGMAYLDKETALYPESAVFITRLKSEYARRKQ